MPVVVSSWLAYADAWVAACLLPLAVILLINSLDELFLDLVCFLGWIDRAVKRMRAGQPESRARPEKRIAILVPLWREFRVIGPMVEHNVAAIRYSNYEIFIGAYPNDDATLSAVRELETRFPNVHLAVCPHDGPTSKADNLNWTYQHLVLHENLNGIRFEVITVHDAEDLIHPQSLVRINEYMDDYDMVQIPVLPLPTPWWKLTHGVYCDEFAEYQTKDIPAREALGGFIPSNGVGTGYKRTALEKLAVAENNCIFEPSCLTEDYENGLRLYRLGCKQAFAPIRRYAGSFLATREYFPQSLSLAIRQRTRWVTGNALQSWERNGWAGRLTVRYWFWRDRKGLIGNPLSLFTNFLFIYGLASWGVASANGSRWVLAEKTAHPLLLAAVLALQGFHVGVRMGCVARIYGPRFAALVPIRIVYGNWINTAATLKAVSTYIAARMRHKPLVWMKTEHAYPSLQALVQDKRRLGEVLVGSSYIDEEDLAYALETQPPGIRIGEYLMQLGKLSEEELYEALSLQQGLPIIRLTASEINRAVARSLPRKVARRWRILPVKISAGSMYLASPELPSEALSQELQGLTRLSVRFQLVTPANYEELAEMLL
ncbi:MAG TPA: glycosyl transferase family protein [Bryobacteraceae bacterium]|nr:glycosyl transferase family protein [Bryobacteraceae bacterium]